MANDAIAIRYAKALFEAVEDKGEEQLRNMLGILREISAAVASSEEFQEALKHPKISVRDKQRLMRAVAQKAGAPAEIERLLDIAVKKGRHLMLPDISEAFTDLVFERLGIARGEVLIGKPIGDELKKDVEEHLVRILGKEVELTYREDPTLIAGAVIRVGHLNLDASVSGELDRMLVELGWKH